MRSANQPESWWGWHGYNHPQALSIVQIMQAGTLPPRLAALFWLGLERGASFVFAADPPGAGKTTLLTALLAFAPPETVAYFTRGWGETFDLPPPSDKHATYIMVNEMSDHLPVYSWGPYVVRAFELLGDGYSLCTTMHADDAAGVVEQLVEDNDVPREHVGRLTFIVPLHVSTGGTGSGGSTGGTGSGGSTGGTGSGGSTGATGSGEGRPLRRVLDVAAPVANGDSLSLCSLARWDERSDAFAVLDGPDERTTLAAKLGIDEAAIDGALVAREAFLQKLLDEDITAIAAVQEAVDQYRRAGAA
jgi:hypothetical protein